MSKKWTILSLPVHERFAHFARIAQNRSAEDLLLTRLTGNSATNRIHIESWDVIRSRRQNCSHHHRYSDGRRKIPTHFCKILDLVGRGGRICTGLAEFSGRPDKITLI